jgi:5-methylcytosine-specific restriction protein A
LTTSPNPCWRMKSLQMIDGTSIAERITSRFGVPFSGSASTSPDGVVVALTPLGMERTQGFAITTLVGWRRVTAEFTPATYARQLVETMGDTDPDRRDLFLGLLDSARTAGAEVVVRINDLLVDLSKPDSLPAKWSGLTVTLTSSPLAIDPNSDRDIRELAVEWASRLVAAVLVLLPLEPGPTAVVGQEEGDAYEVLVTRYERSQINRAACIAVHGVTCHACGFDFSLTYGPLGEGVIDVHHVQPVSTVGPGTAIDPIKDLVPLCANCHRMAHQRRPAPYSVAEIQSMLRGAATSRDS